MWLFQLRRLLFGTPSRKDKARKPRHGNYARPGLELLETRVQPSGNTYTPTIFTDSNTPGTGSLRDAVIAANADPGTATDTIQLSAGTYDLTIQNLFYSGHEGAARTGDLNITAANHTLVIDGTGTSGSNATIINAAGLEDRAFEVGAGVTVVFENLVIENGKAADNGVNNSTAQGGGILSIGGNVTLSNVVLRSNQAIGINGEAAMGGGVYSSYGNGVLNPLVLNRCTVEYNSAIGGNSHPADGGGVYSAGSLILESTVVLSNAALGGSGVASSTPVHGGSAAGGGVFVAAGSASVVQTSFVANLAEGGNAGVPSDLFSGRPSGGSASGGGLWVGFTSLAEPNNPPVLAPLNSVTFHSNEALGGSGLSTGGNASGGGVYITAANDNSHEFNGAFALTFIGDDVFTNNDAQGGTAPRAGSGEGGAIYTSESLFMGDAATFTGNTAVGGAGKVVGGTGGGAAGGAVYLTHSLTSVVDPIAADISLGANTFKSNRAQGGSAPGLRGLGGSAAGGGLYVNGDINGVGILDSTFSGNYAQGGYGGGSLFSPGTGGNAQGGGLYIGAAVLPLGAGLSDDTVFGNFAQGGAASAHDHGGNAQGGGIYTAFAPSDLPGVLPYEMDDVTIASNAATGGATRSSGAVVGTGSGGGLYIADSPGFIDNCLIASNQATSAGPDVLGSLFIGTCYNNLLGDGDGNSGFISTQGNLVGVNPLLGPLGNYGGPTETVSLRPGSPAIGAGDPDYADGTDQRGLSRPHSAPDIGAFESNGGAGMYAVGSGPTPGQNSQVNVYNADGTLRFTIDPFPGFSVGVSVAVGDVNNEGAPDIIVGSGAGKSPEVNVYSGVDGSLLYSFYVGPKDFHGGVSVAVGNVQGGTQNDIVVGAGAGGVPRVGVFNGIDGSEITEFQAARPSYTGGVNVATAPVRLQNDGADQIIAGQASGGSEVHIFNLILTGPITYGAEYIAGDSFTAFGHSANGVSVAGSTTGQVIVGAGPGSAGSEVKLYSGNQEVANRTFGPASNQGGITVASTDVNGDGVPDLIVGDGPHSKTTVTIFAGPWAIENNQLASFSAFGPNATEGVSVG